MFLPKNRRIDVPSYPSDVEQHFRDYICKVVNRTLRTADEYDMVREVQFIMNDEYWVRTLSAQRSSLRAMLPCGSMESYVDTDVFLYFTCVTSCPFICNNYMQCIIHFVWCCTRTLKYVCVLRLLTRLHELLDIVFQNWMQCDGPHGHQHMPTSWSTTPEWRVLFNMSLDELMELQLACINVPSDGTTFSLNTNGESDYERHVHIINYVFGLYLIDRTTIFTEEHQSMMHCVSTLCAARRDVILHMHQKFCCTSGHISNEHIANRLIDSCTKAVSNILGHEKSRASMVLRHWHDKLTFELHAHRRHYYRMLDYVIEEFTYMFEVYADCLDDSLSSCDV